MIDSGIGISEDGQQKLFHPFTQADRSIQKTFGGTGLGLWLSQSIIKLFNGKITIDSKIDEGSTFKVGFPVKPVLLPDKNEGQLVEGMDNIDNIKKKISGSFLLIAEDLSYNQQVIIEICRQLH